MATISTQATSATAVPKRTKDLKDVSPVLEYLPFAKLSERLHATQGVHSPVNDGRVSLIVERPEINGRNIVSATSLTPRGGMANSGWYERPQVGVNDQICVMSEAVIRAITDSDDEQLWAPAGDNLFFDFELGNANLKVADRVQVGSEVILEVSPKPHTGCAKFARRYGVDALKAVSGSLARERRLRGIYFFVVNGGSIKVGDAITKLHNPPSSSTAE